MGNEEVLKVFHAARQDIEIVWHQSGTIPHPIFDTQVAAMVLGYGDSIAYDQLVERVTGHRPGQDPPLHRLVAPAADTRSRCITRSPTSPICATCSQRSTPT